MRFLRYALTAAFGIAASASAQLANPVPNPADVVQAAAATTGTDGTWSVAWGQPFADPPRSVVVSVPSLVDPYVCQAPTITATGAAGKCWKLTPSTLAGTVTALPGTVVSPFVNAAAGLPVMVVGRK